MDEAPLFSLIAPVVEGKHLLSSTLDSLKLQTERRFELILIDGMKQGKVEEFVKPYDQLVIRVYKGQGTYAEQMNQALRLARGKYVQFLSPGDHYLSREGLAYLAELVENQTPPHLVYSGFLMRGSEVISFPLEIETLHKGVFSRDSWFLRQLVIDLGGFDPRLSYRSGFDLLCRLFFKQGIHVISSHRILTDGDTKTPHPRAMVGYAIETYRILYRHFGLWTAIRWVFVQNHLQMFGWLSHHFKRAFWRQEDF